MAAGCCVSAGYKDMFKTSKEAEDATEQRLPTSGALLDVPELRHAPDTNGILPLSWVCIQNVTGQREFHVFLGKP
jgi:hypothetical protein